MFGWIYNLLKLLLLLVLPFILLIRGAVYFHGEYDWLPGASLLISGAITTVLLFIYLTFMYGRVTGKIGSGNVLKRRSMIALLLVLGYSIYGLFFLSNTNAKSSEVRSEFTNLHPIVRLSISTILFLDHDLIITDAKRRPEDYKKMGLSTKKRSLHYKQKSSGYVHAVDIRTNDRSELRNTLLIWYFKCMGLNTLRHGGTADHLHISLKSHDSPGAI